jgi:hypothetical protein
MCGAIVHGYFLSGISIVVTVEPSGVIGERHGATSVHLTGDACRNVFFSHEIKSRMRIKIRKTIEQDEE